MKDLTLKVKNFIQSNNLFSYGDTIIIGVSGGADSISLAFILNSLRHELGIQIHIAHYNHKLRKDSDRDEAFVAEFAENLNIPYTIQSWNKKKSLSKGSIEELARIQRFNFFTCLAKTINADAVALAHTENDQAETVLMRILRGTGLQGIQAILPHRIINKTSFVRPLLEIKRKEIEQYLTKYKLSFRTDSTNNQTHFFRNQIRLELLPLLKNKYNSNIQEVLVNFSKNASVDYEYLDIQTQKVFNRLVIKNNKKQIELKLKPFLNQHRAIRHMLIRYSIGILKGDRNGLTLIHLNEAEDMLKNRPTGTIVHLPKSIKIKKKENILILYK